MNAVLAIHVAAGGLAMVLGAVALTAKKGGTIHRRSGLLFVCAMLVMAVSAAILGIRNGAVGNVVAAFMTAYFVGTALTTVRPASRWTGRINAAALLLAMGLALLAVVGGINKISTPGLSPGGVPFRTIGVMSFMLAAVLLLAAVGDVRIMRVGPARGGPRLARHLWRMCFALFIAAGSFFLGQAKVIPKPIRIIPLLAIPVVAVLVTMLYWLWRIRVRRSFARIVQIRAPEPV
jgi:uncharacterized membrane protein